MPRDGAIVFGDLGSGRNRKAAPPLLRAAILSGISLGCAVAPHSGNSTGKLFMPVGNTTEMLATGAAEWFLTSILAPVAITLVNNAAPIITEDTWGMAWSPCR